MRELNWDAALPWHPALLDAMRTTAAVTNGANVASAAARERCCGRRVPPDLLHDWSAADVYELQHAQVRGDIALCVEFVNRYRST